MTHSVVLQGICDHRRKFINCFVGFPGSAHDARVLQNSNIYKKIMEDKSKYFTSDSYHLVGDSAYPLKEWLLVPYKDNGALSDLQQRYNKKQSQTRIVIECSFALLKGRFRRLRKVISKISNISHLVLAACVLHNICIDNDDEGNELVDMEYLELMAARDSGQLSSDTKAKKKRDYINSIL